MSQSRFYLSAGRLEAERIFRLVEQAFDDDGFPVSILEVDEDKDIHEVSLYIDTDIVDETRARLEQVLVSDFFGLTLGLEDLQEADRVGEHFARLAVGTKQRFAFGLGEAGPGRELASSPGTGA